MPHMRPILALGLLLMAACAPAARPESLGRMGGAPPTLQLTSAVVASNGAVLGEAVLIEETGGDRIVVRANGLPEGRHPAALHARAACTGTGFADAGPQIAELPPLEVDAQGRAELFADVPLPRLRAAEGARLDADGLALIVTVGDAPLLCASFRNRG